MWIVRAQGCYLWFAVSLKRVTALLQAAAMVLLLLLLLSPDCGKGCGSSGPQQQPPQHRVNFLVLGPATPARTALCSTDTGCGQGLRITGIYFAGPRTEPRLCPQHQDTPHPAVIYLTTIMNNYEHPHTLEHLLLVQ